MKTAIAISAMMRNVLSVAKIPPATVMTSQMARIALRIVPMIRPIYLVCARLPWQATGYRYRLESRRPPRRVSVGKAGERAGLLAKRLLPFRAFEAAAKTSLGV
jgi:hypothetical protein